MSGMESTPPPDSNDTSNSILVGLVIAALLIVIGGGVGFWYYRKQRQYKKYGRAGDDADEVDDMDDVDDIVHTHKPLTNTSLRDTHTAIGDNEDEGLMSDHDSKRYEVQQWFNDNVSELSDHQNSIYSDLFIQNGYDVVSAFRYINKSELEMMGIEPRHVRIILDAIKR
eukprot:312874_1